MKFYLIFTYQILKSLSFSRLFNFCKLYISFVASHCFKIHSFNALPSFISIEPTNICNLQCPECPTGNKSSIVEKGKISYATCEQLFPQITRHVIFANLYFQGEPFINEELVRIATLAHKENILTSVSTNAHFITQANADAIVSSGITKIIISLDGYDQESYEKYRRNGQFQKVIDGLQYLQEAKQRNHTNLPLIELQCLLFKHTEQHKQEIADIGKKFSVDRIIFKTAQFYDNQNIEMLPSEKNSRYTVHDGQLDIKKKLRDKCWKMWSSCVIAWNGNVLPCCFDKNHTFTFGNIMHNKFSEIWFSKTYSSFRKNIHTNRQQIKMCQNCSE